MLLTIASTFVVALTILVLWFFIQAFSFRQNIQAKCGIVAGRLEKTLALPLWSFDKDQLNAIAQSELLDPDFSRIDIVEPSGSILLSVGADSKPETSIFGTTPWASVTRSISYRGFDLGWVTITATGIASTKEFALTMISQAILIFLVGSVVAFILFFSVDRRVSSRISVLRKEIGRFSSADLGRRATDRGEDEIGDLASTFNAMAETVERYGKDLESLVDRRTAELERKNEELLEAKTDVENRLVELRRTQDQLIESAKFAEMGRILAQIVHELNSPIAAIRATIDQFVLSGLPRIADLPSRSSALGPAEIELIARLAVVAGEPQKPEDFRARRARRAEVRELVAALGAGAGDDGAEGGGAEGGGAEGLAERIFELGLDRDREGIEAALRHPSADILLEIVETVATGRIAASTLDAATQRASYVLGSLRNYLHSERGGEERSRFPVGAEVDAILAIFAHRLRDGIELERNIEEGCEISGFRDRLAQVWMNLIDNAIQAMKGRGRLSVSVRAEGGRISIEVGDTGPGIPSEVAPMIFEPFFTTKKQGQGTGLGLAIAKRVVEDHGGSISWTSEPGRTLFRVELPAGTP